jgi:voltage-gated potassium channel
MPMIQSELLARLRRHQFLWLLISVILCVIASPLEEMGHLPEGTTNILFNAIILAALNAATRRRTHLGLAGGLVVIWLLALGVNLFALDKLPAAVVSHLALIGLMFFTMYLILVPLLTVRRTDFDILCGAVAIYLLIAIAWAVSFDALEMLMPGSFDLRGKTELDWPTALYFSLTTVTTLGYGDIIPVNRLVGTWATLEAAFGQLYIAVLVARLVSLMRD